MGKNEADLQGRGGGHGNYDGLSVKEISDRFDQCIADPSMRSVSAVLRITREQIMARGHLSNYPRLAVVFLVIAGVCYFVTPYLPPDLKTSAPKAALGGLIVSAILGYGALTSLRETRANTAQEREIYRVSAEAIEQILSKDFAHKPLTREQVDTLKDLVKRHPDKPELQRLLNEN